MFVSGACRACERGGEAKLCAGSFEQRVLYLGLRAANCLPRPPLSSSLFVAFCFCFIWVLQVNRVLCVLGSTSCMYLTIVVQVVLRVWLVFACV